MHLGAWTKVLLGVGEEVVRTCSRQIRPADLGVSNRQLRISRRSSGADEIVRYKTDFN